MALAPPDEKSKFTQGIFVPKNPQKYIGGNLDKIVFRSSWELVVMQRFDEHPYVLHWSSESVAIPYKNPFTGYTSYYYPDFFVVYIDGNGNKFGEIIEVKPVSQSLVEKINSKRDAAQLALNTYKWDAAEKWCLKRGIKFRVVTEVQLFESGIKKLGGKIRNKSTSARSKKAYLSSKKRTGTTNRTRTTKKRR